MYRHCVYVRSAWKQNNALPLVARSGEKEEEEATCVCVCVCAPVEAYVRVTAAAAATAARRIASPCVRLFMRVD